MKNKNNIPILKGHTPKIKEKETGVTFSPVYGPLGSGFTRKTKHYSDVIILDVGPNFFKIDNTIELLEEIKLRPMKTFKWIDHHNWPQELIDKYKCLKISNSAESCAELIDTTDLEALSRTIVFYGADCDGLISAALVSMGKSISQEARNELIKIAKLCDTARFTQCKIANILHQAVYMARFNTDSDIMMNSILQEIINWASNKMNNKCLKLIVNLSKAYDENILPNNIKILNSPIVDFKHIKAFNTAHMAYVDLSYICSMLYQDGCKYVLFMNSGGISINCKAGNIDLTKEFNTCGIKHKVYIPIKNVGIKDLTHIIDRLEDIRR